MLNNLTHDFNEICSGTSNHLDPVFVETAKENLSKNQRMISRIGKMMSSYEKIYGLKKDEMKSKMDEDLAKIAKSKGDIDKIDNGNVIKYLDQFKSLLDKYGSIYEANATFNSGKNFKDAFLVVKSTMKETNEIVDYIKKYKSYYEKSYDKKITLLNQEYECSCLIVILATLNSCVQLNCIFLDDKDLSSNNDEFSMAINKVKAQYNKNKPSKENRIIRKVISDLLKELKSVNHAKYLEVMIKAKDNKPIKESYEIDSILTESSVTEVVMLINAIRTSIHGIFKFGKEIVETVINTITGIIPLIRSIIFLNYKKKVDAINKLEEQINYLEMNINQLKNMRNGTKEEVAHRKDVINKQTAILERMRKKARKMKEEFNLLEDEVEEDIEQSNAEMRNDSFTSPTSSSNDDFVLD